MNQSVNVVQGYAQGPTCLTDGQFFLHLFHPFKVDVSDYLGIILLVLDYFV